MRRALDIQFCGSVLVIGAFVASELAAEALSRWPGSPLAWYVNLQLFRPFEAARIEASPLRLLFGPGSLAVALALLGLTVMARWARFRLGVALAANGSFVFATALTCYWVGEPSGERLASLATGDLGGRESTCLVALMLAASFAAFALSHLSFAAAIGSELRIGTKHHAAELPL